MKNKKGEAMGEQLSIFFFLFLMIIVAGGIVAGIFIFIGGNDDYREIGAEMLNYKIRECLMDKEITGDFFEIENFFTTCKFNKEIVEKNNLIKICEKSENCVLGKGLIEVGTNINVCGIDEAKNNKAFPRCFEKDVTKNGKIYNIVTGSIQNSIRRRG